MRSIHIPCSILFLISLDISSADVSSLESKIDFDVNTSGVPEMSLNTNGLGVSVTNPTQALEVSGNAIINGDVIIGNTEGNSTLEIHGTLGFNIENVTSDTTLSGNSTVFVDTQSGNINLTLPYAANVTGRKYMIKKTNSSHSIFITGAGNYIDNFEVVEMTSSNNSLPFISVISNGEQWYISNQSDIGIGEIASDNLMGWWKFDETSSDSNISDSSSNGHSGTWINIASANIGVPGKIGRALDLDGSDDHISINSNSNLQIGTGDYCINVWIFPRNLSSSTTDEAIIGAKESSSDDWYIRFRTETKTQIGGASGGTGIGSTKDSDAFSNGSWWMLTINIDRSTDSYKGYRNATFLGESGALGMTGLDVSNTGTLKIGIRSNGADYWNGMIDDFRIYNKTLTTDEINALYKAGNP